MALVFVPLLMMFLYALFSLGKIVHEILLRCYSTDYSCAVSREVRRNPTVDVESLEFIVRKELKEIRLVSRAAPMLGLVAAMIPAGFVFLSGQESDITRESELLVVASAAVIVALLATAITFSVMLVRRHWLMEEVAAYLDCSADTAMPKVT
jgi:biopolymer transport protein ExbB/TolQ